MTLVQAKKLHNGDEVTEKKTNKVWRIIAAEWKFFEHTFLRFSCVDAEGKTRTFYHTEIK